MINFIDHIAIGAASLQQGVSALQERLGVTLPAGGKHDQMGTHNCLAQAGEGCFIELIAIDPDVPDPARPRWFTLDNPDTAAHLAERPRALCWVVNTTDLDALVAQSPVELGEILNLSRGDRHWRLSVPKDGSLLEEGLLPAFIEWPEGPHPSQGMADIGLALQTVYLGHPDPAALQAVLAQLNIAHLASVYQNDRRALSFTLETAKGPVTLD